MPPPRRPARTRLAYVVTGVTGVTGAAVAAVAAVAAMAALALPGCLGPDREPARAAALPSPPPVVNHAPAVPLAYRVAYGPPERLSGADLAYYRTQLETVRPRVPEAVTVRPVALRDPFWLAEFDDGPWGGPPAPALPPLPGEALPGPASARGHAAGASAARPAAETARPAALLEGPEGPEGMDPLLAALHGQPLRPIEQMAYGAEYPEALNPDPYRLQPRDRVRLTVRGHPELSGEAAVSDSGLLAIPNTEDRLQVRGRTAGQAAALARQAVAPYVRGGPPEVHVETLDARGAWYQVFGAVRHPGRFPMGAEPVRLSAAVLAANWDGLDAAPHPEELGPAFPAARPRGTYNPPEDADLSAVLLYTPHRSQPSRSVHNLEASLLRGAHGDDPWLRPGQVVVVPSRHARLDAPRSETP